MAEQRNIVVVGASLAGVQVTHYVLKHILPALKAKNDAKYHVYTIAPSSSFWFRIGAPRVAASTTRLAADKITFDLHEAFKQYSTDDFTFIEASATGLNTTARTISYQRSTALTEEQLSYHALVAATGSSTDHKAFSSSTGLQDTLDSIASTNECVQSAKSIFIVGGGPTAVEFAGEVAEHRNGKPGWFSNVERKVNITLITGGKHLLPTLTPAAGKRAERKLHNLGVDVMYDTRVTETASIKGGRTSITLANGKTLEADYFVPAYGVSPNSSWLPRELLDDKNYLITNDTTLRVDIAGPRVYALGDIASNTNNTAMAIGDGFPVLAVNMKRDLMSYNASLPNAKPRGKDRLASKSGVVAMVAPIGSGGGVGEMNGWRFPSFFVWFIKGRDYLIGMSGIPTASGASVKKEIKWSAEEAAI